MIIIIQDHVSHKWGVKITEQIDTREGGLEKGGAMRPLLEFYEYVDSKDAMDFALEFQKALAVDRTRIRREGGIWMYEVGAMNGGILYSEGGWIEQPEAQEHLMSLKQHSMGFPNIQAVIKPINMTGKTKTAQDLAGIDRTAPTIPQDRAEHQDIVGAGWGE